MRFGLALPYVTPRAVARFAQLAEEAGWDGCFLGDAIWCEDPMIGLAAAAMTTSRIRLGTLVTPAPLRRPWKLASEAVALDHLSHGRLTLGLGAGAVWMGWQGFPDEVTATKARVEMLDETIEILTLLDQRKPFDYEGKHYHLRLTLLDEMYYPPKPIQQPRVPLWVVGIWPHTRSMQRVLKGDGVIVEKRNAAGEPVAATPTDIAAIRDFLAAQGAAATFDIVMNGKTGDLDPNARQEKMAEWRAAGLTWWIEAMWDESEEGVISVIRRGPPATP